VTVPRYTERNHQGCTAGKGVDIIKPALKKGEKKSLSAATLFLMEDKSGENVEKD